MMRSGVDADSRCSAIRPEVVRFVEDQAENRIRRFFPNVACVHRQVPVAGGNEYGGSDAGCRRRADARGSDPQLGNRQRAQLPAERHDRGADIEHYPSDESGTSNVREGFETAEVSLL